ncbi:hypothetical protein Harman_39360 [Haloarcula mannanilytica]|uniref:Uncharacterized protein n=1 Tax=Haloarcula mannanilytica TaxID=2509225 RepID=A0A4C2EN97_9EURY|nr:hypothetical protein Harman_39360 [Haloarcula mannanilytica]
MCHWPPCSRRWAALSFLVEPVRGVVNGRTRKDIEYLLTCDDGIGGPLKLRAETEVHLVELEDTVPEGPEVVILRVERFVAVLFEPVLTIVGVEEMVGLLSRPKPQER